MTTHDDEHDVPDYVYKLPLTAERMSLAQRREYLHSFTRERLLRMLIAELDGDQDWVEINDAGYIDKQTLVDIVANLHE